MKYFINIFFMCIMGLSFTALSHNQINTEAKQFGQELLDTYQKQPIQNQNIFNLDKEQQDRINQNKKIFEQNFDNTDSKNDVLKSELINSKLNDKNTVIYANDFKKPNVNNRDYSGISQSGSKDIDLSNFYHDEEKIELYNTGELGEAITHFEVMKSISDPMKDNLGGIGQSTNPTVIHGKCQKCTITLGSGFKDCCDLNGIAKGLLGGCRQEEKELANAALKDKRCVLVQSKYCSKKKLGVCVEKKSSYCCYGSQMGKIIQEIAHQQLNIPWGEGKNPNCTSLTSEQLSSLNFDAPYAKSRLSTVIPEYQNKANTQANQAKPNIQALQNKLSTQYKKPTIGVKK